jgi:excisionase family DNA binding protein
MSRRDGVAARQMPQRLPMRQAAAPLPNLPFLPTALLAPARSPDAGTLVLLSVEDVASALQASTRQIRRLIASGELLIVRIGKLVRIHPADLDAFIEHRRQQATAKDRRGHELVQQRRR